MKLPIEQQAKTAATEWFILDHPAAGKVALPVDWLAKDVSKYDGELVAEQQALNKFRVDWRLSKGSLKSALKSMDDLHGTVNDVYTLVDEGYVDGRKAILAFR